MRPLKLRMKAFISYKDEQTIDFTQFDKGLFIIDGDIGAGKTTIFDAISFALFGEASGSDRKSDYEVLHCNLVPKSVDTEVEFLFSQSGKEYRIVRTIHFPKKRGTENEYQKGEPDGAWIYDPDCIDPIKGPSKVTDRVNEIIGLNKDQFSKIIMLAQGEFKEFLKSGTDKKYEILKKIFDTSVYERYQNMIALAYSRMDAKRSGCKQAIENYMESVFTKPDPEEGFDCEMFLPGAAELLESLEKLVAADQKKYDELEAEYQAKQAEVVKLNKDHAAAESVNRDIDELETFRAHLTDLEARTDEMKTLKGRYDSVYVVVNKLLNLISKQKELKTKDGNLDADIAECKSVFESVEKELKAAREAVEADKDSVLKVESITKGIAAKEALMHLYDEYDGLIDSITERIEKLKRDNAALEQKKKELEESDAALGAASEEKATLAGSEEAMITANGLVESCTGRLNTYKDLVSRVGKIREMETANGELGEKLEELKRKAVEANRDYTSKYESFLGNQAAILADKTGKKLNECGEADCPVCGTHLVRGILIRFAKAEGDVVSEDDVNSAREKAAQAEKERAACETEHKSSQSVIDTLKAPAVSIGKNLFGDDIEWKVLGSEGFLESKGIELDNELSALKEDASAKTSAHKRSVELDGIINDLNKRIAEIEGEKKALEVSIEKETEELKSWQSNAESKKSKLEFDSKTEAMDKISRMSAEAVRLQEVINSHIKAENELSVKFTAAQTALNEKIEQKESLAKEIASNNEALNNALAANSFSTVNDAAAIIDGIEDPDEWIKDTGKAINDYNYDVTNTREKITSLEEKTAGKTKVVLADLEEKIEAAEKASDACRERAGNRKMLLDNHKATLDLVREKKAEHSSTEKAWEIIQDLNDLAVGTSAVGGKLSFERYIMGAFFEEILERANYRLDDLTGGCFQLKLKTTADKASSLAGIDVEIVNLDADAVLSKTGLSGGETFLASLALALGLSDVAQSRYGGQTLDSLFIDEGFGTLDGMHLDKTMEVLKSLTNGGDRLVGVISHVDSIDSHFTHKVHVEKHNSASVIKVITG
ncbi:DNA repair exonuclease SbcCD ATPase subunit [Ruminococcaceae bacterium YRB3002]|nr:DNA repair exonuclease SbcCD ATPase subunit [Ruminococcaceae bacterium YRB3002]